MTKDEFKLRALLAMCSNSAYASQSGLNTEAMIEDAEELANKAKEIASFEGFYDEPLETTKKILYDTCAAIEEISMPDGKLDFMNDTLKGIEKSLDYLNELLSKAIAEDEETECDV